MFLHLIFKQIFRIATKTIEMKEQFGSVIYTTPIGWNVTKYPDGDILTPVDLPKGEFLEIWVQQSMNFSGTMEQALQKSYDDTVKNPGYKDERCQWREL